MFKFRKKEKTIQIKMPFDGVVIPIEEVPDEVFSKKMVGDGFAILPSGDTLTVTSPCDGTLIQIFKTNHAAGICTNEGLEMIIHVGIDTVNLKGEGFTRLMEAGSKLVAGDPLIEVALSTLTAYGKATVTPVVFTEKAQVKALEVAFGEKKAGETVCTVTMKG